MCASKHTHCGNSAHEVSVHKTSVDSDEHYDLTVCCTLKMDCWCSDETHVPSLSAVYYSHGLCQVCTVTAAIVWAAPAV